MFNSFDFSPNPHIGFSNKFFQIWDLSNHFLLWCHNPYWSSPSSIVLHYFIIHWFIPSLALFPFQRRKHLSNTFSQFLTVCFHWLLTFLFFLFFPFFSFKQGVDFKFVIIWILKDLSKDLLYLLIWFDVLADLWTP